MRAKNTIVINFLKGLRKFGFIGAGVNSVLHLPTGHLLEYPYVPFFGETIITEDSTEEELENSEIIVIKCGGNEVKVNYLDIIDFYIEEYARRDVLLEGANFKRSFEHMRNHLDVKFLQEGYDED